jgi:hypothetical protein
LEEDHLPGGVFVDKEDKNLRREWKKERRSGESAERSRKKELAKQEKKRKRGRKNTKERFERRTRRIRSRVNYLRNQKLEEDSPCRRSDHMELSQVANRSSYTKRILNLLEGSLGILPREKKKAFQFPSHWSDSENGSYGVLVSFQAERRCRLHEDLFLREWKKNRFLMPRRRSRTRTSGKRRRRRTSEMLEERKKEEKGDGEERGARERGN